MLDWENNLKELRDYDVAFEIKQGYYHVSLVYKNGWSVLAPDNEYIYAEERNGVYHYIAATDSVKVEDIFNTINATIAYNQDLEKKLLLFKEKTLELQEIFSKEDYETLQTIEFVFGKREVKEKKKRGRKKKNVDATEDVKIEDDNAETTVETTQQDVTPKEEGAVEENVLNNDNYEEEEEIVTMSGDFIEELERK